MSAEASDDGALEITADAVRHTYLDAKKEWCPPSQADCERIASVLSLWRGARAGMLTFRARPRDPAGERRVESHDAVRDAIGTLLKDLPILTAWAPRITPEDGPHAKSLLGLLAAAHEVAMLWPSLDVSIRRFQERSDWKRAIDPIVGMLISAWERSNPDRTIGKPLKDDQPATKVVVTVLKMLGYGTVNPKTVANHFVENPTCFALIDSARADREAPSI